MSKSGFHWRDVHKSIPLQNLDRLLRDADGPLTGMEIQEEAKRRGFYVLNPGTSVGELGMNPGYKTSGGVLFPDRQYRYWLIEAPGWSQSWRLVGTWKNDDPTTKSLKAYKIVRGSGATEHQASPDAGSNIPQPAHEIGPRLCSCGCKQPVPADRAAEGYMTVDEEHRRRWIETLPPKTSAAPSQGSLL